MKPSALCGLICLAALFVAGCDTVDSSLTDDQIVVEAFLYAQEPVTHVRITKAVPLTEEDTVGTPITDAVVRMMKQSATYALVPAGTDGFYTYPGEDLTVEAGDTLRLEAEVSGQFLAAETVVPPPPTGVVLSSPVMEVPTFGAGRGPFQNNAITVSWDNQSSQMHYVLIESLVSGTPEYILPDAIRERFGGFRFITRPTSDNFFDIQTRQLEVFGLHQVLVYRINEEYAELYENREQDSRDLNEPPTNIQGGLGIFSAFNSQRLTFEVVRSSE